MSGDHIVTQAQTGIEGSFEVSLEPGLYTFEVAAAGFDTAAAQIFNLIHNSAPLLFTLKNAQESENVAVQVNGNQLSTGSEGDLAQFTDEEQEVEQYLKDFALPRKPDVDDDF